MGKNYDFSGWATKNDLKCSDGRTIRKDAFIENDGTQVPLVWNHQHDNSANVLGHAMLENKNEGVYAYCYFNDTDQGKNARELVRHGDISALSIYANQLREKAGNVFHGAIREVSLVLAGANPGAFIDDISFAHSEDSDYDAIIFTGEEIIVHSEEDENSLEHGDKEKENEKMGGDTEEKKTADPNKEETVQDVFNTLNEKQKTVVYALIGEALNNKGKEKEDDSEGGEKEMKHNVFDQDNKNNDELMHAAMDTIIADGKRFGSLKESFLAHADEYGIRDIDWLFPEAKRIDGNGAPQFIKRTPDAWVDVVMNGVHYTPFSRIKMMFADLREDDARAKGYAQKGKLKKEEVFGLLKRTVEPTTIYKKQKLDRDDLIDITDFDVVSWLKSEMRMMLDEEIARAILFGDGRSAISEDKISETNIIPIVKEQPLFLLHKQVNPEQGESFSHAFINAAVKGQDDYEGSGDTILFTANEYITDMLLMEDKDGHRMYMDVRDLALAMSVNRIVKVPASIIPSGIYGVIVDLKDYNVGADKGGSVNMFDDFDIDYNQQKYLIETRCSGALTKPFSAIVLEAASISG